MKNSLKLLLTSLTAFAFGLTACAKGSATNPGATDANKKAVLSIEFSTDYEECAIGDSFQIVATIKYRDDKPVEVEKIWNSSKVSVATVEAEGDEALVSVVGSGTTFITLKAGYQMASCKVYVPEEVTPVDPDDPDPVDPTALKVTLSQSTRTIEPGGTFSLTATPSRAADVTFSVSDASVLKINAFTENACEVEALAVGEADLVATAKIGTTESATAKCHVSVVTSGGGDKDYTIFFYIDYNNVDPKDDTKLLAKFDWYYDRPFSESGLVPTVTNDMAMDPAFPYFIGWSTHPIIDTKDNLWDINNDTVADLPMVSYTVVLYGQWFDVPVLPA